MKESWTVVLLPILVGAIAIALYKFLSRYVMKSKLISPLQFLVHCHGSAALYFTLIYVSIWGFTTPQVLPGFWRAVLFGTAANFLIQFLNAKAASIDTGEVSLTAPLQAMTPGLISGLALFLGEYPSKIGYAGIALMICGSYILLWEKTPQHWYEYFGPVKRLLLLLKIGRLSQIERNRTIVVTLAMSSACLGTIGLLFDGLYVRRGINFQGLTLAIMAMFSILALGYVLWYFIRTDIDEERHKNFGLSAYGHKKYLLALIGLGILWLIIIYTIQPTFNHTYVAYTGTLKRLSILMAVGMGILFFKEGEAKKRFWAAMLIIAGAILVSMDDLPSRISTQIQGWGL